MTTTLFRLRLEVPARRADHALAAAIATGAQGAEVRDEETGGVPAGRVQVITWHADTDQHADASGDSTHRQRTAEALRAAAGEGATVAVETQDGDWVAALAGDLGAVRLGRHFMALPPGDAPPGDRRPLWLESGGGFGSGLHPTTALCVAMLESRVRPDVGVLDVGCGSGVLAIAALLLGARAAVGVDIDSVALAAATRNAVHNAVEARASWGSALPNVGADLVLANLYPGPLTTLASALCDHVNDGGALILSGFRAAQRPAIEALYATHGLHVVDAQCRAGWHCLVLKFHPQERPRP